jgi:hypothetical protein
MPNGDKLKPKTTREHLLSIYLLGVIGYCWGSITSIARKSFR